MHGFFYIGKFHRQNQAESHIFLENGYQIKQKFCIDTRRANHTSKKQVEASLSRLKAPITPYQTPKAPGASAGGQTSFKIIYCFN